MSLNTFDGPVQGVRDAAAEVDPQRVITLPSPIADPESPQTPHQPVSFSPCFLLRKGFTLNEISTTRP